MLVGDIPRNNARRYPEKTAVVEGGRTHTWSMVDERAGRLARYLVDQGLRKGDRVLVIARNCLEWPEATFALAKAGLVAVPVNIRLAPDELVHVRDDSGARAAIVHTDQIERFGAELVDLDLIVRIGSDDDVNSAVGQEYDTALYRGQHAVLPSVDPDDILFVLYTSGTTGRSKGVVNTHRALLAQAVDTNLVTEETGRMSSWPPRRSSRRAGWSAPCRGRISDRRW